jgi:hypothetical protein
VRGSMASHRKTHLRGAAQPGANFIELEVRKVQVAEGVLMEELSVLACPSEPPRDGGLTGAEDAFGGGSVQPFSQRGEHHGDLVRGGFQTVQGSGAPGSEGGAAGRASERLDALGLAMLAIPDEGVDVSIGIPEGQALLVGTGVPLGVDSLGCSPPACDLAKAAHRSRCWPSSRRGRGGESAGWAIVWAAGRCRRRWSLLRLALPREEEGRRGNQRRRPSLASERRRQTESRNTTM